MTTENQLLPCPFCGCELRRESNRDWHRLQGDHGTGCPFEGRDETLMSPATDEQLALLYRNWNARAALTQPAQAGEAVAYLHDDGFWTAAKTDAGRQLNDRLLFAGSPKIGVYTAPPASQEQAENRELRRMLCVAHAGALAYMDDGEAQDSSAHPAIDYLRDSLDEIKAKRLQRASQEQAQQPDHLPDAGKMVQQPSGGEVVAWMWQHDETGRTGFVDRWQVENGWQEQNPRLKLIHALTLAPKLEPMTRRQQCAAFQASPAIRPDFFAGIRAAEAHHHITSTSTKEPQR